MQPSVSLGMWHASTFVETWRGACAGVGSRPSFEGLGHCGWRAGEAGFETLKTKSSHDDGDKAGVNGNSKF